MPFSVIILHYSSYKLDKTVQSLNDDRILIARPLLHSMQRGNYKNQLRLVSRICSWPLNLAHPVYHE